MIELEKVIGLITLDMEVARTEPFRVASNESIQAAVSREVAEILSGTTLEDQQDLIALLWLGAGSYDTFEAARRDAKGGDLPPHPAKGQLSTWLFRGMAKIAPLSAVEDARDWFSQTREPFVRVKEDPPQI